MRVSWDLTSSMPFPVGFSAGFLVWGLHRVYQLAVRSMGYGSRYLRVLGQGFTTWNLRKNHRTASILTVAHEFNASSASTCTGTACCSRMKEKVVIAGLPASVVAIKLLITMMLAS